MATRNPRTHVLLACLLAGTAHAHNGALTVAEPLSDIQLDGDFSDWPATTTWHAIDIVGVGQPPRDADDLSARFAVGFDAERSILYVAIEERDESLVLKRLDDTLLDWYERDRSEIYLILDHTDPSRKPMQFVNSDEGIRGLAIPGGALHDPAGVRCAHVYRQGRHRFEWAVETRRLDLGARQLEPGQTIGFDVSIVDHDSDDDDSWVSWGIGIAKFQDRYRIGDVYLPHADPGDGRLEANLHRQPRTSPWERRDLIDIRRSGDLVVTAPVDDAGSVTARLSPGTYTAYVRAQADSVGTPFVIGSAQTTRVALAAAGAAGRRKAVTYRERDTGAGTRDRLWHSFGHDDGLSGVSVLRIEPARDGGLWLGTQDGGVMHWDGRRLQELSTDNGLPFGGVNGVVEDARGRLWIAMSFVGLMVYDAGQLTRYDQTNVLADDYVGSLMSTRDGAIWASTLGGGVIRFDDSGVCHITEADGLLNNSVTTMAEAHDGDLWFGTINGGACRYDGTVFRHYTDPTLQSVIHHIVASPDGRVWFATAEGVVCLDDDTITVVGRELSPSMASPQRLHLDGDGVLWVAGPGGLTRYEHGQARTFTTEDGLPDSRLTSVAEDREGNIWVGTVGAGLSRYVHSRLHVYPETSNLHPRAMVERSDGSLWMGTHEGDLCQLRAGELTCWPKSESSISDLLEDHTGRLWIGYTPGGLACLDGDRVETFTEVDGLPANQVTVLAEDTRGNIWVGTRAGLGRWGGSTFHNSYTADGLGSNTVGSLVADSAGGLWVLTSNPGRPLSYFDGQRFQDRSGAHGHLHLGQNGVLWSINADGLRRRTEDTVRHYTRADGVPTATLMDLATEPDGTLWLATTGGTFVFDGNLFQLVQEPGPTGGASAILQDTDGDWWLGGSHGLARYSPVHTPPPVTLVDVVGPKRLGPVTSVEIPATEDLLAIEYYGVSFKTRPDRMAYRYRVTGLSDEWQYTRKERVELEDLPLGEYVFELEAIDRDLAYSEEPLSVHIAVVPAYGSLGLYGALGLAAVIVAVSTKRAVRRRHERDDAQRQLLSTTEERNLALEQSNERLREADRLKSDFVSNVSHELRTPLTVIKGSVANMMDGVVGRFDEQQAEYLERLRSNSDRLTRLIDDLLDLSRIEAGHLELMPTQTSVCHLCESVVDSMQPVAAEMGVRLKLRDNADHCVAWADPNRVHQVLLNLVNNAIKFTPEGGEVSLVVNDDGDFVRTSVVDTGPGIPDDEVEQIFEKFHQVTHAEAAARGAGIGLSIARHLVELHGGRIWAESVEGEGSTFRFTLPRATEGPWPVS